jgi:hypothetical protein
MTNDTHTTREVSNGAQLRYPMTESESLFTPVLVGDFRDEGTRARMTLDADDMSAFDSLPRGEGRYRVIVTDTQTGMRYLAWRSECGLGCYCDAMAERLNG